MSYYELNTSDVVMWSKDYTGNPFHALFSDFPYFLEFMGRANPWDTPGSRPAAWPGKGNLGGFANGNRPSFVRQGNKGKESQEMFQSWGEALMPQLHPGALALVFGGTRTWHRLAVGMEDAGFEMWDTLMYMHGTGFPKAQALDKLIDKRNGDEREVEQSTPWSGHKTCALKPAWEPIIAFKKSLEGTYAENAMKYGSGALNIDGARVGWPDGKAPEIGTPGWGGPNKTLSVVPTIGGDTVARTPPSQLGRYPANLILECICDYTETVLVKQNGNVSGNEPSAKTDNTYGDYEGRAPFQAHPGVAQKHTNPDCPSAQLDAQTGDRPGCKSPSKAVGSESIFRPGQGGYQKQGQIYPDNGGASRFFYTSKVSPKERNAGMPEGMKNNHPTLKPIALTTYIAKLLLPPALVGVRRILVPFSGSGSEIIGCLLAGWDEVVGIEQSAEYNEIAKYRIDHALQGGYDKFVK